MWPLKFKKKKDTFFPNTFVPFLIFVFAYQNAMDIIRKCLPEDLICIENYIRDWNKDCINFATRKHIFLGNALNFLLNTMWHIYSMRLQRILKFCNSIILKKKPQRCKLRIIRAPRYFVSNSNVLSLWTSYTEY